MEKIRAISLHQPWASYIANGFKTIETRTWETSYKGDIVICSTKNPKIEGLPCGMALCIAEIYGCRRMLNRDEEAAMCIYEPGRWSWLLRNIRKIEPPFAVRGRQGIFEIDISNENDRLICGCGWIGMVDEQDALGTECGCCPKCGNEDLKFLSEL